jgi:integrating conjugative element protein (TIGR03759 family)
MATPQQRIFVALIILPISFVVFAKDKGIESSSIRFSASHFSLTQTQQANLWELNIEQWQLYQKELQGPRGLWSPKLNPLAVLGMRKGITVSERNRLATKLVKIERARVKRELAFEQAYQKANLRLFGHIPLYKVEPVVAKTNHHKNKHNANNSSTNHALKYYLQPPCKQCRPQIQSWIKQGKSFALYIAAKDKQQVQAFAKSMGISPLLVPSQISLHLLDKKSLLAQGILTLPAIRGVK